MKSKILFFLLFGVLLIPFNIRAECDYQRKAELMKLASNVKISYNYVLNEQKRPVFTTHLTNVSSDIYVVDMFGVEYRDFVVSLPETVARVHIYSNDVNCPEKLLSLTLNVPSYNIYSELPECAHNSNTLCDMWLDTSSYSEEEFKKIVTKNAFNSSEEIISESDNDYNYIYIYLFIAGGVIVISFAIVILFVRRKKILGRKFL